MTLPTPAQIALALAINRSKPVETSVEEYFAQVRETIVEHPRKQPLDDQHYIDGVLFWKQAYERCQADKATLENRLFELEHKLPRIESISPVAEARVNHLKRENYQPQGKQSAKANTRSKRQAAQTENHDEAVRDDLNLESNVASSSRSTLLRCLFTLERSRQDPTRPRDTCLQAIRILCHATAQIIKDAAQQTSQTLLWQQNDLSNIDHVFNLVSHSWNSIMLALASLEPTTSVTPNSSCIPEVVFLFQTFLDQLHQSSLDEADQRSRRNTKSRARSPSIPSLEEQDSQNTKRRQRIRKHVTIAMCDVLESFSGGTKFYESILEGLYCALLDHIGSSLSLMVFADIKSKTPPELGLLPPRGLVDVGYVETNIAVAAADIAAPYLICVLRKAVEMSISKSSCSQNPSSQHSKPLSDAVPLSVGIRTRFQCTLLRGVYGDDKDGFKDAFARSAQAKSPNNSDYDLFQRENNGLDWFISQIWEQVGWDVLISKLEATTHA